MFHRIILCDITAYLALVLELHRQAHVKAQHRQCTFKIGATIVLGLHMKRIGEVLTRDALILCRIFHIIANMRKVMFFLSIPIHIYPIVTFVSLTICNVGSHTILSLETWHQERQFQNRLILSGDGQVLLAELYLALFYAEVNAVGISASVNRKAELHDTLFGRVIILGC